MTTDSLKVSTMNLHLSFHSNALQRRVSCTDLSNIWQLLLISSQDIAYASSSENIKFYPLTVPTRRLFRVSYANNFSYFLLLFLVTILLFMIENLVCLFLNESD